MAASASDVEDRIRALQALSAVPADQAIDVLVLASRTGTDYRERAAALTSLRMFAARGDVDPRIANALRTAATDPDPIVRVIAESALESADGR